MSDTRKRKVKTKRASHRQMVAKVLVPVISEAMLARVEHVTERASTILSELQDVAERLDASLSVLRGDNHPEGWLEIEVLPTERATKGRVVVDRSELERLENAASKVQS